MSVDFLAFDTETINRPGFGQACLLAKYTRAGVLFFEPKGGFVASFDFLAARPVGHYVAWNMDFDARALIHPNVLPWAVCENLGLYGHAKHGPLTLRYIPNKFLEVRHADKRAFIVFDLQQFFGGTLEDVLRVHFPDTPKLKIPETWYDEMDVCLKDRRRPTLLAYAARDVDGLRSLTGLLLDSLRGLGIRPVRLSSCASLARSRYGKTLARIRAPDYLNKCFERGFFGGRIECLSLGLQNNLALYDLNSAYPSEIARLKDPTKGTLRESREAWRYLGLPDYGLYRVDVSVPIDWDMGPFAVREGIKVFYPVGRVCTWVCAPGLDLIHKLKLSYRVRYAYEIFDCRGGVLFPDIGEMYDKRKDSSNGLAIKLILNSIYGLMAESVNYLAESPLGARSIHGRWTQSRKRYGKLTNFVLASHVTESIRLRLWEAARYRKPVFLATDSMLISRDMEPPILGTGLGEWSLKGYYDRGVVLGCGRYRLEGKKPEYHLRGFSSNAKTFERLEMSKQRCIRIQGLETKSMRQWAVDSFAADYNVLSPNWRCLEVRDDKRFWPQTFPLISDYFHATITSNPYIVGRPEAI